MMSKDEFEDARMAAEAHPCLVPDKRKLGDMRIPRDPYDWMQVITFVLIPFVTIGLLFSIVDISEHLPGAMIEMGIGGDCRDLALDQR